MQKTIQMCLAAAVLSVSGAVSIPDGIVIDTKCEKYAVEQAEERRVQCETIQLAQPEEDMCRDECANHEGDEVDICFDRCIESVHQSKI